MVFWNWAMDPDIQFRTVVKPKSRKIMIQTTQTLRRVATTDAAKVDDLLNSAVEGLIPVAIAMSHGIRVTRTGPGHYTAETTAEVECGYTVYEHR